MGYNRPQVRAVRIFSYKYVYSDGAILEAKAWKVPISVRTPEGCKYSLAYIDPNGLRVLGYDNSEGKGHHRHDGDAQTPTMYSDIYALIAQFLQEVARIRREYQ